MSTRYKTSGEVPNETLAARLDELSKAVASGRYAVAREFTMSVPAEVDSDADLVLQEAAQRLQTLAGEVFSLRLRWTRLGALVEFGEWGVCRQGKDSNSDVWVDDGAELESLLDSPEVAAEADFCERALRTAPRSTQA